MIPVAELGGPAPTSWVDEGDEEVDRAVKRAIYFAYAHDEWVEDFYAFDPDSVDERGEMRVGAYHHDTGSAPTAPDALERLGVLEQHAGAVSAITIARSQ